MNVRYFHINVSYFQCVIYRAFKHCQDNRISPNWSIFPAISNCQGWFVLSHRELRNTRPIDLWYFNISWLCGEANECGNITDIYFPVLPLYFTIMCDDHRFQNFKARLMGEGREIIRTYTQLSFTQTEISQRNCEFQFESNMSSLKTCSFKPLWNRSWFLLSASVSQSSRSTYRSDPRSCEAITWTPILADLGVNAMTWDVRVEDIIQTPQDIWGKDHGNNRSNVSNVGSCFRRCFKIGISQSLAPVPSVGRHVQFHPASSSENG